MGVRIGLVMVALTVASMMTTLCTTRTESSTTIQLIPSTTTIVSGSNFTLNVTVTDVTSLAVWEFRLFYPNTILNCTNIVEGSFLKAEGSTFFVSTINNTYNETYGWLVAGSTLLGGVGANGTGTLAAITFQAVAAGEALLQFSNDPLVTFLLDSSPPPRQPIPFTTVDEAVHVTGVHDVVVNSVESYKSLFSLNYSVNITVTASNDGDYPETFDVTVYTSATVYPSTTIVQTLTVNDLLNGTSAVLSFLWNTTGFTKGNYTISAYALPVPGEAKTQNNNLTSMIQIMLVRLLGDVVSPFGVVDMKDIAYVAKRFGSTPSTSLWDPNADLDSTIKVDMRDIAIVARGFGNRDP